MPGSYRSNFIEKDLTGYITANSTETGAMVLKSRKGPNKPILCRTEQDVLNNFGNPSSTYPSVFEALSFVREAPCWIGAAIGSSAYWGGVDVTASAVLPFGGGRGNPTSFVFSSATQKQAHAAGTGTGVVKDYTGTIANVPISHATLMIKVGSTYKVAAEAAGVIAGSDIDTGGTNTLDVATGAYSFRLKGTVGVAAVVTGNVATTYNLSTNKYVNITIDNVLYEDVDLSDGAGDPTAVTNVEVVAAINGVISGTHASVSTNYVRVTGTLGSKSYGNVKIEAPTSGASALQAVFSSGGGTLEAVGTDPTGAIPKYGEAVSIEYVYTTDISATVSHSFFAASPCDDELAVKIQNTSGSQYKLTLYQIVDSEYIFLTEYDYSLLREKNGYQKNIYIEDVFKDNTYLIPKVNTAYAGAIPAPTIATVDFAGGARGGDPSTGNFTTVWNYFNKPNKYPAKIFMDVVGNSAATLNTIVTTYQYYAHAITCVPYGNTYSQAITFRNNLSLDSDKISIYTNWREIYDVYNDSYAWISNIGSVGRKFAQMVTVYDGLSPAGPDENNLGGQISDWETIEMENDYLDSDLQLLDAAQLNPIIQDDTYGVMIYGDKTMKATLSDTSFIHTRRLYNLIIEAVVKNVLRQQEFKNNDVFHRLKAKSMVETFLQPILAKELMREVKVICSDLNNTNDVLERREFVLDIISKATPNSQKCTLRLTRVGQNQVLANIIPS